MFDVLQQYNGGGRAREAICQEFDRQLALLETDEHSDRDQVLRLEEVVARDPESAFEFDGQGWGRLRGADQDWRVGRFSCPALLQLRQDPPAEAARLRLWVLEGTSRLTDIGALQALAPADSLFQVASQYNCLESPGPYLARVRDYFFDPTQGPRASISAYPGTLLRHYSAPGPQGQRFVQQTPGPQLNLLQNVALEGVARVESGYLLPAQILDHKTFANLLQDHFEDIQVGLHESTQVALGANWDGRVQGERLITQVFTSTLAAGGYGRVDWNDADWLLIARQLQRAAYLGTLRAAATTGQNYVVLTLIGGGVFGNPLSLIWETILWACRQVGPDLQRDLTVIVNGRNLTQSLEAGSVQEAAQNWGGDLILCSAQGSRFWE